MKDKKGFTLVELIGVFFLMALILLFVVPSLRNLMRENQRKEFTTYEDMMVEYTKSIPRYKDKSHVCLKDLDMENINEKTICNGYVTVSGGKLTPYLSCTKDEQEVYKTKDYSLPSDCN